jgi:hypothetical protein
MSLRSTLSRGWPHRSDDNADAGEVKQDAKEPSGLSVRAKRLRRSLANRSGNPAFSVRATAKHIGIDEKIVRLMLRGERPVADHHVAALPPSLREDVEHGTPSERQLLASTGIRRAPR